MSISWAANDNTMLFIKLNSLDHWQSMFFKNHIILFAFAATQHVGIAPSDLWWPVAMEIFWIISAGSIGTGLPSDHSYDDASRSDSSMALRYINYALWRYKERVRGEKSCPTLHRPIWRKQTCWLSRPLIDWTVLLQLFSFQRNQDPSTI